MLQLPDSVWITWRWRTIKFHVRMVVQDVTLGSRERCGYRQIAGLEFRYWHFCPRHFLSRHLECKISQELPRYFLLFDRNNCTVSFWRGWSYLLRDLLVFRSHGWAQGAIRWQGQKNSQFVGRFGDFVKMVKNLVPTMETTIPVYHYNGDSMVQSVHPLKYVLVTWCFLTIRTFSCQLTAASTTGGWYELIDPGKGRTSFGLVGVTQCSVLVGICSRRPTFSCWFFAGSWNGTLFDGDATMQMYCNFEGFLTYDNALFLLVSWNDHCFQAKNHQLTLVMYKLHPNAPGCVSSTMTSSCNVKITGGIQHLRLLIGLQWPKLMLMESFWNPAITIWDVSNTESAEIN